MPGNANSGGLSLDGNGSDWPSAISANGTYVVFQSSATNLVPGSGAGDQNGVSSVFNISASNVYLYDTQTNTIQLVSAGLNGAAANGASYSPQISADGDYVIFESTASNLVAGGSGGQAQTYVYDIADRHDRARFCRRRWTAGRLAKAITSQRSAPMAQSSRSAAAPTILRADRH